MKGLRRGEAGARTARKKKSGGLGGGRTRSRDEVVDLLISTSISQLDTLPANEPGAHTSCEVGVSGLWCAAVAAAMQHKVRRRLDRTAVRPRCSDARCRARGGAPRRWRRVRGGGADTIVHEDRGVADSATFPSFGNRHQIPRRANSVAGRGPRLRPSGYVSSHRSVVRRANSVAGRGPVSGHQATSCHVGVW